MFILVRTDPDAPKHDGISFMLLPMEQPGVRVKPIRLISGESPFNEVFFDNAIAAKDDLVGELNKGWTVGKRPAAARTLRDAGAGARRRRGSRSRLGGGRPRRPGRARWQAGGSSLQKPSADA